MNNIEIADAKNFWSGVRVAHPALAAILFLTLATPLPATADMMGLGSLVGTAYSVAHAVSADGKVVVGVAIDRNDDQSFRWTQATGMKELSRKCSRLGPNPRRGTVRRTILVMWLSTIVRDI